MAALQRSGDAARYLYEDVAEDVVERLGFLRHQPGSALVLGDAGEVVGSALARAGVACDRADTTIIDPERPWPKQGFDLIVASFAFDTANDLPGALIHARNALAPGGLLLATMLGAGTMTLLRQIMLAADGDRPSPRIHPQVDVRAGAQLLQRAGLADPVADSRGLDVRFSSLDALLRDLRAQGLGSVLVRSGPTPGKAGLARARQAWADEADAQGRLVEHFELLTLSGWRR